MGKYIDSEKLIAEIERSKSVYSNPNRVVHGIADAFRQDGRAAMCDDILKKIDSLQQEQPFPRWIHANYSDKPEIRQSPSGGPYLQSGPYMIWLSDLETLPKDGTDLTNPIQEQPEVDLEKEIKSYFKGFGKFPSVGIDDCIDIAKYFYELGRNARKEE